MRIVPVLRYTATQVVCQHTTGPVRFRLSDGVMVGTGNKGSHVVEVTSEIINEMQGDRLRERLRTQCAILGDRALRLAKADRNRMANHALEARLIEVERMVAAVEGMMEVKEGETL